MARLIGYMANRGDALERVLKRERSVLHLRTSKSASGWGVGFFQNGEVLHRKRPHLSDDSLTWESIASGVQSDCVLLHVRKPTVGDFRVENTHPFRLRNWLFAQDGTIGQFAEHEEALRAEIPDFLARNIRGQTDSEYYFHLTLRFLHEEANIDHLDLDPRAVVVALHRAKERVEEICGDGVFGGNSVITNGRFMIGYRDGGEFGFAEREFEDALLGDLSSRPERALRYVMMTSALDDQHNFTTLERRDALIVHRSLRSEVIRFTGQ